MCRCNTMKLILAIPLLLAGLFIAFNYPELRRYVRIERM